MNKQECEQLIEAYIAWLKRGLSVERLETACELTTPFLDRHNDHLQVYAINEGGKIILSDDGYVLSDLKSSGLELRSPKRTEILDSILAGFGVRTDGKQLVIEASKNNIGQRLHSLIQAMLAINDMFVMAQSRVASFFREDVQKFLEMNSVRYSARIKLAGRSGFDHFIDFLIPKSETRPERFIQAINAPDKSTIGLYLWTLDDIRQMRKNGMEAYAFLNNQDQEIGGDIIEALEAYMVKPALWSQRASYVEALAQ